MNSKPTEDDLTNDLTLSHPHTLERGMGEVYLAEDTQLDRNVAIKFLPPESTADEQAKKRLVREARAAAKLDHPNICAIHEVGEADGRSFIVMQYADCAPSREGDGLRTRKNDRARVNRRKPGRDSEPYN